MKSVVIIFLVVLMLLACSCKTQNDFPEDTQNITETEAKVETVEPEESDIVTDTVAETELVTEPPTDDPKEDDDYKNISLRETSLYESKLFAVDGSQYYFSFSMPKEWTVLDDEKGGYNIVLNGIEIGKVYSSAKDGFEEWKTVDISENTRGDVKIIACIEKRGIGETLVFRRRYCYFYKEGGLDREIMITVKYEEMSDQANNKMSAPLFDKHRTDARMNILSDIADSSIVIIGNSFVNTSNIGAILTEMVNKNGKTCKVTAISRSLVTLHAYVNDAVFMKSIEKGKYDAVFACGLYYTNDINNLGKLKEVCDISGTRLIIFPAHNESSSVINGAKRKYSELECLDWRGEINMLIEHGVSKSQMCVDDEYLHSTPMAGYVGAHMIYRAMYGEIPKDNLRYVITYNAVYRVLGDYTTTGNLPLKNVTGLSYIK